ncbi:hypothetical protein HY637_00300 [Candidatus Woesearchaeota archaeon]|nr:hypothetical protein [Candidatus Woesearchaeota archaeon]
MAGFWAKYYSTIFKGLTATSWKEKREISKLVKGLHKEDHELYVEIRDKVAEHRVTSALHELENFIKKVRKSAKIAEEFIFNAITQDQQIIKAEQCILDALKELSQEVRKNPKNQVLRKIERSLAIYIYQGTKDAEGGDRDEYKIVMEVLDEVHKHHKDWMEKIRTMFQVKDAQNLLARWIIRAEISREKRDIQALRKIAKDIKSLAVKVKNQPWTKGKAERIDESLENDYKLLTDALKDAFYESYLIKKRDLLMFLKILFNLHNLRQFLERWTKDNDLPRSNVGGLINKIMALEEDIAKHFQPIAQGFRIIIHSINNIEKLALEEYEEMNR